MCQSLNGEEESLKVGEVSPWRTVPLGCGWGDPRGALRIDVGIAVVESLFGAGWMRVCDKKKWFILQCAQISLPLQSKSEIFRFQIEMWTDLGCLQPR